MLLLWENRNISKILLITGLFCNITILKKKESHKLSFNRYGDLGVHRNLERVTHQNYNE